MTSVQDLVAERAALREQVDALAARLRDIDAQILEQTTVGEVLRGPDGSIVYKVAGGRRTFSATLAQEVLAAEIKASKGDVRRRWKDLRAAVTRDTIDGAQLKALSPPLWERCTKTGAPFITTAKP